MNTQYSSLEEVWGTSFPKKTPMTSKNHVNTPARDPEREGRIFPTPVHRTAAAVQKHRKTIDDLSTKLPIVNTDEDATSNFAPARVQGTQEHFTSTKAGYSNPQVPVDVGADFPQAPPSFQQDALEVKLNRILRMIEQNKTGQETPGSQDMMLQVFTGAFFLFTLDTFVNLGRRMG